ncbi:MAG: hypothetical protein P4L31_05760 [Candidatus Babeliales bacterium]|nr:hypothetical protein [Candidatus Babeliales bacterium]
MISYKTKIMMILTMGFAMQGMCADIEEIVYEKTPMRYPQCSEIQKRTGEIRRELLMARIKQSGFQAVALMSISLAAFKIIQGGYQILHPAPVVQESIAVSSWQEVGPGIIASMKRLIPPFLSFDWFKYMGGYGIDGFMMVIVGQAVASKMNTYLSQDLFHPDHGSMKWFAKNKTSFLDIMEELKQYVLVLDGPATKSQQNKEMYDYFIISSVNNAVVHVESIIGFIDYKQSLVSDELATQMAHISRYLFNVTDQFCHDVDELLVRNDIEPCQRKAKMESMTNDLRTEVARIIVSFARIEAEQGI